MKKNIFGKKLGRDIKQRKALFRSLMNALVIKETIRTTEAKAKAIKPEMEKFVTKAKNKETAGKILEKEFTKIALEKLINDIAPRFSKRPGGYIRLIRLGKRLGDNANVVIMEWVEKSVETPKALASVTKETAKKTADKKSTKPVRNVSKAKPAVKKSPAKRK